MTGTGAAAGDEVIIPAPYWVSYPQMVKLAEGTPVFIPAPIEQDFKITAAQLEKAITHKTRLIILCSPCNPTGSIYSAGELESLAQVILKHEDLYVISDEIYEHLNYSGKHASIAVVPGMTERTIIVNGVSKAYAMTGWRIGFIAAPETLEIYNDAGKLVWSQNYDLLKEAGADVLLHTTVLAPLMEGRRVVGVRVLCEEGERTIPAKVVIDATGNGMVAAAAGGGRGIGHFR